MNVSLRQFLFEARWIERAYLLTSVGELIVFCCQFEKAFPQMLRADPGKPATFLCPLGIGLRPR